MTEPLDEYVKLLFEDFATPEQLRQSVREVHLWKADKALEKCIDHLFKASNSERLNLYRLLCYIGSRIDEIKKDRHIWRRSYKNEHWNYTKYE
ncbi:MAG: hypothetical protein ACOWW1_06320 [archaeon]